jgi:hypothetical protein
MRYFFTHTERENIMSTNGYEIRLELLKMAKEMLEQDWHAQRDAVMTDYNTQVIFAQGSGSDQPPASPTFRPFPTEEEIIKKAKVLNEFVAQRE